jgi:hypothetical protein
MARRLLAIAFVLAALAPEAFVSAQQSTATHSSASHATSSSASHATTSSNSKSATTSVNARHSAAPNASNHHHSNVPPWSNSVYVNGGSAAQYLATSKPKPPPPKNKVNTGNGQEVFKSISN